MKRSLSSVLFCGLLIFAAAYISLTASQLPPEVASHFGAAGLANGFMPRALYLVLMLALTLALPIAAVTTIGTLLRKPGARMNLPNRDYWLTAERRADTVAFLRRHMLRFGCLLIAFLCFVHWMVMQANAQQPARLADSWLISGTVLFLIASVLWIGVLHYRFRRRG